MICLTRSYIQHICSKRLEYMENVLIHKSFSLRMGYFKAKGEIAHYHLFATFFKCCLLKGHLKAYVCGIWLINAKGWGAGILQHDTSLFFTLWTACSVWLRVGIPVKSIDVGTCPVCEESRVQGPFSLSLSFIPFQHADAFWGFCSRWLLKSSWQKKKLLIMKYISFCHNIFYSLI